MEQNLAIFSIIFIIVFLIVVNMYGNEKYPSTNKNPFASIIAISILFFIIVKVLIWSFTILF